MAMELHFHVMPKCQCGNDLIPLFDHERDTHEAFIKGWYCIKDNKFYMITVGEIRVKTGKEWVDKPQEERKF